MCPPGPGQVWTPQLGEWGQSVGRLQIPVWKGGTKYSDITLCPQWRLLPRGWRPRRVAQSQEATGNISQVLPSQALSQGSGCQTPSHWLTAAALRPSVHLAEEGPVVETERNRCGGDDPSQFILFLLLSFCFSFSLVTHICDVCSAFWLQATSAPMEH